MQLRQLIKEEMDKDMMKKAGAATKAAVGAVPLSLAKYVGEDVYERLDDGPKEVIANMLKPAEKLKSYSTDMYDSAIQSIADLINNFVTAT